MNDISPNKPVETFHPLSEAERRIEQSVLVAIGRHFADFQGPLRDAYDAMTARTPVADGVTLHRVDRDGVQGWWVRPAEAPVGRAILFLHGGAYALGSATAYRGFASQIAVRAAVSAFVLDYPLAPEHPFPAAHDAALAARRWLGNQGITRLAAVGDSAGGALALSVATDTDTDCPAVAAVVVFSPWVDLALAGPSFADPATRDPIFQPHLLASAAATYLNGAGAQDGRASPLQAFADTLPPLAIQVGTDELLLDDARRYAVLAAAKGGEVRLDVFEGLHHVFQRSVLELASAGRLSTPQRSSCRGTGSR